jgi:hypothetical protein
LSITSFFPSVFRHGHIERHFDRVVKVGAIADALAAAAPENAA